MMGSFMGRGNQYIHRGRYRISRKGGRGLSRVWIFIFGPFVAGHITRCMDKMSTDKILGDKTPVKIARWDKMLSILWDRESKIPIFVYNQLSDQYSSLLT